MKKRYVAFGCTGVGGVAAAALVLVVVVLLLDPALRDAGHHDVVELAELPAIVGRRGGDPTGLSLAGAGPDGSATGSPFAADAGGVVSVFDGAWR